MPACPGKGGPHSTRGTAQIPSRNRGTNATAKRTRGARAGGSPLTLRRKHPAQNFWEAHGAFFRQRGGHRQKARLAFGVRGLLFRYGDDRKQAIKGCANCFFLSEQRQRGHEQRLERIAASSLPERKRHSGKTAAFQRSFLCPHGDDRIVPVRQVLPSSPHTFPTDLPATARSRQRGDARRSPGCMFRKSGRRNHARACHLVCGP